MRGDYLGCDAAVECLGEGIGEGAADGDVAGGECAQLLIVGGRLIHRSVVHILPCDAPCAALTDTLDEGCAGRLASLHVGHVVQVDGLVADAVDECGVVEDERGIVVGEGDVVAAEGCHMGTHGQTEEVVGRLGFLGGES